MYMDACAEDDIILKETALQGTITWSEMGKLNIQYWLKKVS